MLQDQELILFNEDDPLALAKSRRRMGKFGEKEIKKEVKRRKKKIIRS